MKNLWGELPSGEDIVPPVSVLKAQADMLTAHYRGILSGDIQQVRATSAEFRYNLSIVAPNLNDYTYVVASLINPITLYPCKLIDQSERKAYEVNTAAELETTLGTILTLATVRKVLAALVAQSRI